jgi:hypothetical protein
MLLSEKDINRLVKKGFSKDFFVKYDELGYAILKNREGYCVFYDIKKRQCSVYVDKPLGCWIYPVMLDEEKGIVLDGICQSINTITEKEKKIKGKRVIQLLGKIDSEASDRRS